MLGGPQAERSKTGGARSSTAVSRDDILGVDRGTDKYAFEGELGRLRRENSTLKDQLQRSLKELKAYQAKYPSAYINVGPSEGDYDQLPSWASSPDIMKPLFEAYDTRIRELESVIHIQTEQLRVQTGSVSFWASSSSPFFLSAFTLVLIALTERLFLFFYPYSLLFT